MNLKNLSPFKWLKENEEINVNILDDVISKQDTLEAKNVVIISKDKQEGK